MINYSTLNPELVFDDALENEIYDVFRSESEKNQPNDETLRFVFAYAAACETVASTMMGQMVMMRN